MSPKRGWDAGRPSQALVWWWVPVAPGVEAIAVPGGHARVELKANGAYAVAAFTKSLGHLELGHAASLATARACAQRWALARGAEHLHRPGAVDGWRMQDASEGQLERLRHQRVPIPPFGYTKGRAADLSLISEALYCHLVRQWLASSTG